MSAKSAKSKDKPGKGGEAASGPRERVVPRFQKRYFDEVLPELAKRLGRDNPHALPRLKKIVVNMGVGSAVGEKKHMEEALATLTQIAGQKAAPCRSKKSISNFRLREGMEIGCKVTLRGARMYEFFDRLVSLAIPRVRDFRGLDPKGFDRHGNYNMGLSEQLVFPEINPDKVTRTQGMNITFVTSATKDDDAREFLTLMGMPFKTEETKQVGAA